MRKFSLVLIVLFLAIPLFAKDLFVFDFDWTLTKIHTYKKSAYGIEEKDKETLQDDLKDHTGDILKTILESGHDIGIATFHINIDSIKFYLLSAGLTETEISKIKIVVRENDLAPRIDKNSYIEEIIKHFGESAVDSLHFYDDTEKNILAFNDYFANRKFKIEGFQVSASGYVVNSNIEHYYDILFKLGKSSFKKMIF